jgi:DNA-directed RNA polymerase specialized sigma24 family protein
MFTLRKNRRKQEKALEYATRSDFQQIFTEDMAGLQLLALLLTADPGKADECFVAGLADNISGNSVFSRWARSWTKRAIIRNAIKTLRPVPGNPGPKSALAGACNASWDASPEFEKERNSAVQAVTQLDAFERFVLVMAVLEGYSLGECASLLTCSLSEAVHAKSLALQRLGSQPFAQLRSGCSVKMGVVTPENPIILIQ